MENVHTYPKFTPEMKATHKILIPNMAPIHFEMMRAAMEDEGLSCGGAWLRAAMPWRRKG